MGIQNWANSFGGPILLVLIVFCLFISTIDGAKSCCPWCIDEANCKDKCSLQKWTLKCNDDRTICHDALTEPDIVSKCKPTSRFKTINAKNAADKGKAVCTVDLPKGMNISDFVSQFGNGYFLKDLAMKTEAAGEINCKITSSTDKPVNDSGGSTDNPAGDNPKSDFSDWENVGPEEFVDVCDSKIYCSGRILQAMNYHFYYDKNLLKNDSKFFVDSPLKKEAEEVLKNFEEKFKDVPIKEMDPEKLKEFYEDNFNLPSDTSVALINCTDIGNGNPTKLEAIQDETMRDWAMKIHAIWKPLCKTIAPSTAGSTNRHSLIPVKRRFIVPGGRFREYYYWDSLWTIKGLLISGYDDLAKDMIENFIELIENKEIKKSVPIPNGGRVYYEKRSQPPLLIPMAYEYYNKLKSSNENEATQFMENIIGSLEKELKFWETNRRVNVTITKNGKVNVYEMFQYKTESRVPRPESFHADVLTALALKDASENKELSAKQAGDLFQNLASAAESGWDFSSRWVKNPDDFKLSEIITTKIVPVDLNAYICGNYRILFNIYFDLKNGAKAREYATKYDQLVSNFNDVFLLDNDTQTGWYDYNIETNKHNERFYASMAVPLFTKCYDNNELLERVYKTFENYGIFDQTKLLERASNKTKNDGNETYYHGIPTSLKETDQQWDLPNIWPPMVHMMIEGFRESGNNAMVEKAKEIATQYVLANYKAYEKHCEHLMFEKLTITGDPGIGGEYEVVAGFGWTNGVILDLLTKYEIKWNETLPACKPLKKSWSFHKHLKTMG